MNSPKEPGSAYIQGLFDGLAPQYDRFNRLTSLGQDLSWRKEALKGLRPGARALDLGCGTGDLTFMAAELLGPIGEVVGLDFSAEMLAIASDRKKNIPVTSSSVRFIQKKAEEIPFEPDPYDYVVSGFVLRNIYENIDAILRGVYRSLKPGGEIRFLDFTEPAHPVIRFFWKIYIQTAVAVFGFLVFGKKYPVNYMAESAQRFVKPPDFVKKLEAAGFKNITTRFFMMSSIVLYQASKN